MSWKSVLLHEKKSAPIVPPPAVAAAVAVPSSKKLKQKPRPRKNINLEDMMNKPSPLKQPKKQVPNTASFVVPEIKTKNKKLEADGSRKKKTKKTTLKKAILRDRQSKWYEANPFESEKIMAHENICAVVHDVFHAEELCDLMIQKRQKDIVAMMRSEDTGRRSSNVYFLFHSLLAATAAVQFLSKLKFHEELLNVEPIHLNHWNTLVHLKSFVPNSLKIQANVVQLKEEEETPSSSSSIIRYEGNQYLVLESLKAARTVNQENSWIDASMLMAVFNLSIPHGSVVVTGMLEAADIEEEDELEDLEIELKSYFETCPGLIQVTRDGLHVVLAFRHLYQSQQVIETYTGRKYGGRTLSLCLQDELFRTLIITDLITPEEVEDEDEFQDVYEEIETYLNTYGTVQSIVVTRIATASMDPAQIRVVYDTVRTTALALDQLGGRMYGGRVLGVKAAFVPNSVALMEYSSYNPKLVQKVEKFPKQPNAHPVREYVDQTYDDILAGMVEQLLTRLMSLQQRAHMRDPIKAKKTRRLVIGFREVKRCVSLHRAKCLVVAYNIDECTEDGGLDEKLRDIIDLARKQEMNVIFALSRRKLGKCLGKSIRVSCAAVLSMDGANELYRDICTKVKELKPINLQIAI